MQENRKHPRKELRPPVSYQVGEGPRVNAVCHDLSLGGMFIETPTPAGFNAKVDVFIQLPGMKGETKIPCVVRWTKPDGMGVQFGMMGAKETHALMVLMG